MRLADFIETHLQGILAEWSTVASTRLSSAVAPQGLALQADMPQILGAMAKDLRQLQAGMVRPTGIPAAAATQGAPRTAAEVLRALAAQETFSMTQLVAEYRILRATVLDLWIKTHGAMGSTTATEDVLRFNEAIDQAVAESVDFFSRQFAQERTAREVSDQELARNRARLAYASRLSHVGFWYCDLPFDVLEWDEQVKQHFFLAPDAIVTIDDFYGRIHPEDRELTRTAIDASISSRNAYDIIYRTRHPETGEIKWIRALGGTDYATDGRPIHFDGITVDVTAQKLEQKRVAESEARHRGVLTNMDEAFTLFDPDFNVIDVNEASCILVGMERSEFIGANHWVKFAGTYDSELGHMYRQVLADGVSKSLEHLYVFEDGREVWFEVRAFKVASGVAVLYRDVTERHKMIDALKDADQRKDEFLAMLAHELRNPLAPITTAGEILSRMPEPPAPVAAATAVIRRQSRHMTRLIDDLLDVARITQGRIHLQKATTDIAAVVAQAVETCESQLEAKQQRLTVSIEKSSTLQVDGDFARLVQCVSNILSNAIKYTDPHGAIEVSVRGDGADIVIRVTDTGSGISPELLPRVFELFVQSDRTLDRAQGGLGVGLAVVRRLIDMHGGQVHAFSAGEGLGSAFEIRLPRLNTLPVAKDHAKVADSRPRRVLIVDDNVDAADTLVILLEMQGHVLKAVHSAQEALACVDDFKPDVMLIDIGLPGIDGYALAQQLEERTSHQGVRKIALTGYGQPEDRQRALDVGFDEHLVKPVDAQALEQAIAG